MAHPKFSILGGERVCAHVNKGPVDHAVTQTLVRNTGWGLKQPQLSLMGASTGFHSSKHKTLNTSWVGFNETTGTTTTEGYTPSLGSGLNVTTTLAGTTRTSMLQLTDIRGDTVTTIDLDANTSTPWQTFDEFGNSTNTQTSSTLVNYGAYGQQQRETNDTGLILMGARVYNPVTNQFTSPDPVPGGNENAYTYPNDPINSYDFNGCNEWVKWSVVIGGAVLTGFVCAFTVGVGCVVGGILIGGVGGFIDSSVEANDLKLKGNDWSSFVLWGTATGPASGAAGAYVGTTIKEGLIAKGILGEVEKGSAKDVVREIGIGFVSERAADHAIRKIKGAIKQYLKNFDERRLPHRIKA